MTHNRAIVTIEPLSNGDMSNDLDLDFKVTVFFKSNISKTVCLGDKVAIEH